MFWSLLCVCSFFIVLIFCTFHFTFEINKWIKWNELYLLILAGICVYNILILSFIGAPVSFILEDPNIHFALIATLIWLATTLTLCVVFGPKVKANTQGAITFKYTGHPWLLSLSVSQQMHKITNLWDFELNWSSKLVAP